MFELPFTSSQFLDIFEAYNKTIWPAQIITYLLGGIMVISAKWKNTFANNIIPLGLAVLWFWMGLVYHILFFSRINSAAFFSAFSSSFREYFLSWLVRTPPAFNFALS